MFCHINSVPTTQQSRLINGDIKNNIREHVHGVVMATRIPNYPVLHTLPCSFMPSGMMDMWGKKTQNRYFFNFLSQLTKCVDYNWTFC